jgi:hypothetical protein
MHSDFSEKSKKYGNISSIHDEKRASRKYAICGFSESL